ncbi:MAG: RsmE family RNA methyltransferase [Pirellulaceae bacterium]|jgi:16S rRNA (uracil1498-N3)-methyltransferase
MALPRFYAPHWQHASGQVLLEGEEATHAIRVLRLSAGDRLVVFDGEGWEGEGTVQEIDRRTLQVLVPSPRFDPKDLPAQVHLLVALPKGDRQKEVVERVMEGGVQRLTPLTAQRSVAQPGDQTAGRLHRAAIESAKQCGRNRLVEIGQPIDWNHWLKQSTLPTHRRLVLHPTLPEQPESAAIDSRDLMQEIAASRNDPNATWEVAIGPEGGWTTHEIDQACLAGCCIVQLGPRILRVEAAVALACHLFCLTWEKPQSCTARGKQ